MKTADLIQTPLRVPADWIERIRKLKAPRQSVADFIRQAIIERIDTRADRPLTAAPKRGRPRLSEKSIRP